MRYNKFNILLYFIFSVLCIQCGNEKSEEPEPKEYTREEILQNSILFGLSVDNLLEMEQNYTVGELIDAGIDLESLIDAESVSLEDLTKEDIPIADLLEAGAALSELINVVPLSRFCQERFPLKDLVDEGQELKDLKAAGYLLSDFVKEENGFNSVYNYIDLKNIGYTEDEFIVENISTADLIKEGVKIDGKTGVDVDQDENTFKWIGIGEQVWMAENLKTTVLNDGSAIQLLQEDEEWRSSKEFAYCWYNNVNTNGDNYGTLYNWYTVNSGKLCPVGWHVPSDIDWMKLEMFLGMSQADAEKFTESRGDDYERGTNEGSKISGHKLLWNDGELINNVEFELIKFNANPGGYRLSSGDFSDLGISGFWWSSSENEESRGLDYIYRKLIYDSPRLIKNVTQRKNIGHSVRCVKD